MPGFTNYLEEKLIRHTFGGAAYPQPAGIYVGLFTAAPGETGGGTEVSGVNYARQAVACSFAQDGSGRWTATNTGAVLFPVAGTGGWGTVTHFALFDAVTGGNMLAYAQLTDPASGFVTPLPKTVDYGDAIRFEPVALQVALD